MTDKIKEPNWKEIAYELADVIDNLDLGFQMVIQEHKEYHIYPPTIFAIKQFRKSQKHFLRYKNEVLYIDDYKKAVEKEIQFSHSLMQK